MKKTQAQTVGEIINSFLKKENLDGKIDEQKIVSQWHEVVGPAVNRYTISRYIKDGKLFVHLSSAPLRNELMMHKSRLITALNNLVGRQVISDIIIK